MVIGFHSLVLSILINLSEKGFIFCDLAPSINFLGLSTWRLAVGFFAGSACIGWKEITSLGLASSWRFTVHLELADPAFPQMLDSSDSLSPLVLGICIQLSHIHPGELASLFLSLLRILFFLLFLRRIKDPANPTNHFDFQITKMFAFLFIVIFAAFLAFPHVCTSRVELVFIVNLANFDDIILVPALYRILVAGVAKMVGVFNFVARFADFHGLVVLLSACSFPINGFDNS